MLKLNLFLLCLAVGTSLAMSSSNLIRNTEINLLRLMMDTRVQQRANPERSLDCFDYYLQLFDSINNEYKANYAACLATAEEDREKVDAATQPERDALEKSARSSCVALKECSELKGSIDYFNCFAISGKDNTENMYEISTKASGNLAEVRESYRLIENRQHRCTDESERAYVEQTYRANLDLQSCLRGETPVPTTTPKPPTNEPSTTPEDTTTEESDTTTITEATTTKEPETTTTSEEETETTAATEETTTGSDSDSSESTSSESKSSSEAPEDFMPEEDLRAIQIERLAKIRAAISKYRS